MGSHKPHGKQLGTHKAHNSGVKKPKPATPCSKAASAALVSELAACGLQSLCDDFSQHVGKKHKKKGSKATRKALRTTATSPPRNGTQMGDTAGVTPATVDPPPLPPLPTPTAAPPSIIAVSTTASLLSPLPAPLFDVRAVLSWFRETTMDEATALLMRCSLRPPQPSPQPLLDMAQLSLSPTGPSSQAVTNTAAAAAASHAASVSHGVSSLTALVQRGLTLAPPPGTEMVTSQAQSTVCKAWNAKRTWKPDGSSSRLAEGAGQGGVLAGAGLALGSRRPHLHPLPRTLPIDTSSVFLCAVVGAKAGYFVRLAAWCCSWGCTA
ncbi:hypothetical protein HaLaN_20568 [Haematococcus lacustris]|uniref:Uncharacterized protein n=1 Tax=Haematococcus lacustris TaxID=44745 RepID=A0A699ZPE4_HAELA|nr:hypothetical protein HaLaN_20568 [Haematococcus lacustris]